MALNKPNVVGYMNPELNRMTDLVAALLDDYIVKYGSNELAYKNLVKEVVKGLPENKRGIGAVVKPAVAEALKYTNIEKFSKNDFGRMTRALATVLATEPDMYGDTFEKILSGNMGGEQAYKEISNSLQTLVKTRLPYNVQHHIQPLKQLFPVLRHLQNVNPELRRQVLQQFTDAGIKFGDKSLAQILTIVHTGGDLKELRLDWQKGLGVKNLDKLNKNLNPLLQKFLAHNKDVGGTRLSKDFIPAINSLKGVTDPREIARVLEPFVSNAQKAFERSDQANQAIIKAAFKDGVVSEENLIKGAFDVDGTVQKSLEALNAESLVKPKVFQGVPNKKVQIPTDWNIDNIPGAQLGADGTATLNPNFYQSAVADNIVSSADNLLAQTTGLVNHLKMQGIKTAIQSPEQLAEKLTFKYGTAGAMSMMLDPKFRQAMSEGRFTDAATRLVIEEAIGDAAFKGLKAGYHNIPGVKPIVQGIGKHIVKPVIGAAVANPVTATAGVLLAAEAIAPAKTAGNERGDFPIKGPDGKLTYGSMEDYNKQRALNKKEQNLPPSAISVARYKKQEKDELWWQQGGAGAK